jgi:hypothetical protein
VALAIHGTPAHTADVTGTISSVSASVTTTVPTVLVAVIANLEQTASGGAIRTVTGVSGGGLTWTKRKSLGDTVSNIFMGLEVWWANATGSLTAQSITATFNLTPNQACDILVFAVSGSPTPSAPWDSNVLVPCTNSHMATSGSTSPTQNGTVTSTTSMLLEFLAWDNNGFTNSTVGAAFADIIAVKGSGSLRQAWGQGASASAGLKVFNFVNNQGLWLLIGDALTGDPILEPTPVVNVMS